jgi:hypothetical protein
MGMAGNAVYQEMLIKKLSETEEALKLQQFENEKLREQVRSQHQRQGSAGQGVIRGGD